MLKLLVFISLFCIATSELIGELNTPCALKRTSNQDLLYFIENNNSQWVNGKCNSEYQCRDWWGTNLEKWCESGDRLNRCKEEYKEGTCITDHIDYFSVEKWLLIIFIVCVILFACYQAEKKRRNDGVYDSYREPSWR